MEYPELGPNSHVGLSAWVRVANEQTGHVI